MYYAYCLIDLDRQALQPCRGLFGEAVSLLRFERLGMVISELGRDRRKELAELLAGLRQAKAISRGPLWQHNQVIQRQMQAGTVLPFSFSTCFSVSQMSTFLQPNYSAFIQNLGEVAGKQEYSIRARWKAEAQQEWLPSDAPEARPGDSPGRDYLRQRQQHYRQAEARHQQTSQALEALVQQVGDLSEGKVLPARSAMASHKAVFLVPTAHGEAFTARYRQLQPSFSELHLLLSGPWAPYHFIHPLSTSTLSSHATSN